MNITELAIIGEVSEKNYDNSLLKIAQVTFTNTFDGMKEGYCSVQFKKSSQVIPYFCCVVKMAKVKRVGIKNYITSHFGSNQTIFIQNGKEAIILYAKKPSTPAAGETQERNCLLPTILG
jgi:hypothetical protein